MGSYAGAKLLDALGVRRGHLGSLWIAVTVRGGTPSEEPPYSFLASWSFIGSASEPLAPGVHDVKERAAERQFPLYTDV